MAERVVNFPNRARTTDRMPPLDNGGGGGNYGDMEARVKALEDSLNALQQDVAVIRSNYATKEDLHKELSAQTWRLVTFVCSFGTALVAATYFIAKHVQ